MGTEHCGRRITLYIIMYLYIYTHEYLLQSTTQHVRNFFSHQEFCILRANPTRRRRRCVMTYPAVTFKFSVKHDPDRRDALGLPIILYYRRYCHANVLYFFFHHVIILFFFIKMI